MAFHHIIVPRTARYATLGELNEQTKEVWFVCHGYGQLAGDFIKFVSVLDDGSRLVVAPEALSRFYVKAGEGKIGASWMTRESRDAEITDYIDYLDAVYDRVFEMCDRDSVSLHALGFSQGVATASRWAARGKAQPDQLILWAERLPPEFDTPESAAAFHRMRVSVVYGDRDEYITTDQIEKHRDRLRQLGIEFDETIFEGGHRLDKATLLEVAM